MTEIGDGFLSYDAEGVVPHGQLCRLLSGAFGTHLILIKKKVGSNDFIQQ